MKTALITGSTRGIGRAIALRLAKDGYKIILHGIKNSPKAEETKALIEAEGGVVEFISADLSQPDNLSELIEKAKTCDVLVLNASVQIKKAFFSKYKNSLGPHV